MSGFGDWVKSSVGSVVSWAGGAIGGAVGGPTGATIGSKLGSRLAGSLMNKGGVGGDYQIQAQNAKSFEQNFGGRLGRERSDEAGNVRGPKTVDGKDLNYEWERRLMTAMSKQKEYKRDLT